MRFLDIKKNKKLDKLLVCLTYEEAEELLNSLSEILKGKSQHEHIQSDDFLKELTICIYDFNNIDNFDSRTKKLLLEDK